MNTQIVIITGGAPGIGKKIAQKLFSKNYNLALIDRNAGALTSLITELNSKEDRSPVIGKVIDLLNELEVEKAVREIFDHFGQINHIIANAGKVDTEYMAVDMPFSLWQESIRANLFMTLNICKSASQYLKKSRGSIVIINSNLGNLVISGALPGQSHYKISKSSTLALANCLAAELAIHGIRINIILPGRISTNLFEGIKSLELKFIEYPRTLPLLTKGVSGQPENVADAVSFLVSNKARYVCATKIFIDDTGSIVQRG